MRWEALLDQVRGWLQERDLLTPEARWVIGVSGGADSVLLLSVLREIGQHEELAWTITVGHVHHGLRGADADADAEFVALAAERMNLPLHAERIDVAWHVQQGGGSTEEVAREHRYAFLERVALNTGSRFVAVAHHADDDAETVLHRICRGTGLRGLAGMRDVRPIQPGSRVQLVRPFLALRRAQIEQFCAARGLQWRTDATNQTTAFTRGRIRNAIIPLVRSEINPNFTEALLRLKEHARWLGTYLEDAAARTFDSLIVAEGPRHLVLNVRALLSKQRIIQTEVIRRAATLIVPGEQDLGFAHLEAVLRIAADPGSGKEVHLPGPVLVRKHYDRLEFRPLDDPPDTTEMLPIFVNCPGSTELPMLGGTLQAEVCDIADSKIDEIRRRNNPCEQWLDVEAVRLPLLVRGRREGDRFWPLGAPSSKSLNEFLGDEKVHPGDRARTGVLCDQTGPIWIMPLRIDDRVKLRPESRRALHLSLRLPTDGRTLPR